MQAEKLFAETMPHLPDLYHKQLFVFLWQEQGRQATELQKQLLAYGGNVREHILPISEFAVPALPIHSQLLQCLNVQVQLAEAYENALKNRLPYDVHFLLVTHHLHAKTISKRLEQLLQDTHRDEANAARPFTVSHA
jgi:hypothetical protein